MCESCQLGKYHRSSYFSCNRIPFPAPFDLLRCDVWGPSCTPYISSHHYYTVFRHDYTHVSWVYLLYYHSKVVTTVTHFTTEVVTQYSIMPKILHIEIALEFVQTLLSTFCDDHGIIHHTPSPCTSRENVVPEREHRQLLDITGTLLIEMHVPAYLWSNALMTATYLQNRLPSTPLGGDFPLHRLLPTSPLFSLPPRVFGCIALVQDHFPSLSKLAPHALKSYLLAPLRHKKAVGYTFLKPVII